MSGPNVEADLAGSRALPDPGRLAPHFQALVENASDLITVLLPDGTIRYQSPSGERVLGFAPAEIVGRNAFEFVHPDDHEQTRDVLTAAIVSPGSIESRSIRLQHRDGSWRELECVGKVVRLEGLGDHIVVNSRDVTERSAFATALAASEERYRRFFEQDIAGHVITGVDGRIVDCNCAFAEMFGFDSPEQARQWNIQALSANPVRGLSPDARSGAERRTERLQLTMRRRDGEPVYVIASVTADVDESGKVRCFRGQMLDEAMVRTLTTQLEASRRAESLGQLAGGIAHHFNNILSTMLGHAELGLARASGDPALAGHLRDIIRGGERAADLTRKLLAVGRRQFLAPRSVSLHEVVAEVQPLLARLIGDDVELRAVRGRGTARAMVDPGQIEQVILDLVLNARDAMPRGGLIVISTHEEVVEPAASDAGGGPPPGRYAVLTVTDDGEGMDAATRDRIFQPFFTTRAAGRGTGLGLAIVHGIVHQSGGHIRVESEAGHGSCFHIHLPLDESGRGADGAELSEDALEPKRPKILLVEDEEPVRTMLAAVLREAGHEVAEAEDGRAGLDQLTAMAGHPPALVVSDLTMPNLGGAKFAEQARRLLPGLPVLFISGYNEDMTADTLPKEEGYDFLQKPFSVAELLERVRRLASRRTGAAS